MILSVCLNPSVDVAINTTDFYLGEINRVADVIRVAGGKGNNVARVLSVLGQAVVTLQPLGGSDGAFIKTELEALGIPCHMIPIEGTTRRCVAVHTEGGITTEIREVGHQLSDDEQQKLLDAYFQQLQKAEIVIASGSLPKQMASDFYQRLIELAHQAKVPFCLDAKGEALKLGIEAQPFMVRINEHELAEYCGCIPTSKEEYFELIQAIRAKGVQVVVVSLGHEGLLANWQGQICQLTVPKVRVASTVGCGDAMMAGLVAAIKRGASPESALREGAAAGTAAAMQAATGVIDFADWQRILSEVKCEASE